MSLAIIDTCTMSVSITKLEGSVYRVRVEQGDSKTEHDVTVTEADVARYAPGVTPEKLLAASFEFLLAREPKESILRRFELPVIARYFSEYPRELKKLL